MSWEARLPAWARTEPAAQQDSLLASISGYVPLRSAERSTEEEAFLTLSHWERLFGFLACLAGSAVCFCFALLFLAPPILALRPHKFALAFSLASVLFILGFAVLVGPAAQLRHLFSRARAPFSAAYLAALAATLYSALGLRAPLLTLVLALVQVGALCAYLAAYFPGGTTTLRYAGTLFARGGRSLLPL